MPHAVANARTLDAERAGDFLFVTGVGVTGLALGALVEIDLIVRPDA